MRRFTYTYNDTPNEIDPEDLPLSIGTGPHAKLKIHRNGDPIIVGHLTRSAEGELNFEPSGTVEVTYARCKKSLPPPPDPDADPDAPPPPVPEPTWDLRELLTPTPLRDGDYLVIGDQSRIDVAFDDDNIPRLMSGRGRKTVAANLQKVRKTPRKRRGLGCFGSALLLLFLFALLLAAVAGWFYMTSKRVGVAATPPIENLNVTGGWLPEINIGERRLMRKGTYRATGTLDGHHPLDTTFQVGDNLEQEFSFEMKPLPGIVHIETEPATASPITVSMQAPGADGLSPAEFGTNVVGKTELRDLELEIAGYDIAVAPERYLPEATSIKVEGYGKEQTVTFPLTPRWSDITVTGPPGATVLADGKVRGATPITFELFEGPHEIILRKELYIPVKTSIVVRANTPFTLPPVRMTPMPARVRVASTPPGAKVTLSKVDARGEPQYKGETPTEFDVDPFVTHRVTVVQIGYGTQTREFRLGPTEEEVIVINMAEQRGLVKMQVEPASAQLYINGTLKGYANRPVYLAAVPQELEVRLAGYESHKRTVTPTPNFEQVVSVKLRPLGGGIPGGNPSVGGAPGTTSGNPGGGARNPAAANRGNAYRSQGDYMFRKVTAGPFRMGSARSEQGRRPNESQREVILSRPFYMGATEVTVAQYKAFNSGYAPGSYSGAALGGDLQPAVNLSWAQAAAYCNWLSEKDGLPKAYNKLGVEYTAVQPMNTGYRLPSEAEWEFCARYSAPGQAPLRFPWGNAMPPKPNSANFAGTESSAIISDFLPSHSDGYQVTGDVGSYPANPLGLHDMGGNVSEWCNDGYKIYIGSKALTNPLGPNHGPLRVWRGSSWRDASITTLRLAYRGYDQKAQPYIGFRVARYVQ